MIKQNFRKSLRAASLISALFLLVSCGSEPAVDTEPQDVASATEPPTDQATEPEKTQPLPKGEPVEVLKEDLGLDPWFCVCADEELIEFELTGDGVRITPCRPGQTTLTVKNVYAEEAVITVSISDTNVASLSVDKFVQGRYLNAREEGARSGYDVTEVLQSCIDRISAAGGGTVYLPSGSYKLSSITMKPGVTLRLAGFPRKATEGYRGTVLGDVAGGRFAKISTTGSSRNNIFIYNTDLPQSYCTSGYSDFTVSGGFYDCQSKMKWSATACGSNITFENAIVLNLPNNHAMQIDGCTDYVVRNIMFAGYTYSGTLTRETIQLEPTTPGAITGDYASSPILCDAGDYHSCARVTISGCYFGKSDTRGPQLVAVGHHSAGGSLVCDGFVFEGNKVENPLYCGLHLPNYVNVVIRNNEFISDNPVEKTALAEDSALISLYGFDSSNTFSVNGRTITNALNYEHPGTQNFLIENNEFKLGGGTPLMAVSVVGVSSTYKNDAQYLINTSLYRVERYPGPAFTQDGFVLKRNTAADITFSGNKISVTSKTAYSKYLIYLKNVLGWYESGTVTEFASDVEIISEMLGVKGLYVASRSVVTDREEANTRTVKLSTTQSKKFTFVSPSGSVKVGIPKADVLLTVKCSGQGRLVMSTDKLGNLTMTAVPDEGWKYAGIFDETGASYDLTRHMTANLTLTVKFVKN